MTEYTFFPSLGALLLFLAHLAVIVRVILRSHRESASRIAWIMLIIVLPVVGMIAYLFLGATNIGRRRARRFQEVLAHSTRNTSPSLRTAMATTPNGLSKRKNLGESGRFRRFQISEISERGYKLDVTCSRTNRSKMPTNCQTAGPRRRGHHRVRSSCK
jgi:hypothetical protein